MEYFGNILCATAREVQAVTSVSNYKQLAARGQITVVRRACRGRHALVAFDSLPERFQTALRERFTAGGGVEGWLRAHYTLDPAARHFYSLYRFADGTPLPPAKVVEYTANASLLGAVQRLRSDRRAVSSIPRAVSSIPRTVGSIPRAVSSIPRTVGSIPLAIGRPNTPAGTPNPPAGTPNPPAGRPNTPAGTQNLPAGTQSTPAGNRPAGGGSVDWEALGKAVAALAGELGHTLPGSALRLRRRVVEFEKAGYESLVSKKFGNQNSRKVDYRTERLILSLDSLPERPYNTTVAELYNRFVQGELEVYDPRTGELLDPADYTDRHGKPLALSEATVANYLNNPKNRVLRAKLHDTAWEFNNRYRPHHHRTSPEWAFSKVSLDDRDLPRRLRGGGRVKAYYAYDVASGCVVGCAYARLKTADLFLECVRDLFRLIERQGWNCPAEIEVEHHLVSNFADGLVRAGEVFPFVRWCNPGNSQEKRAEHFNRAKKYGVEKRSQVGIGRWYARLEANRPRVEKVYDERNDTYREAQYTFEELVADDRRSIERYNHQPHPNQRRYPGLTRWQVLCERQNPALQPVDRALLSRYVGERTRTSIRRNMYCLVQGVKFLLPSPELIARLAPNDYTVDACWLPDAEGRVAEVHLYQGERFLATCRPVGLYNEAAAERTPGDEQNYRLQAGYVARFDAMLRRDGIRKVRLLPGAGEFSGELPGVLPGQWSPGLSAGRAAGVSGELSGEPAEVFAGALKAVPNAFETAFEAVAEPEAIDYAALAREELG